MRAGRPSCLVWWAPSRKIRDGAVVAGARYDVMWIDSVVSDDVPHGLVVVKVSV